VSDNDIPENVRRFIAEQIRSVIVLEALLLMHGQPGRAWSAGDLGTELRVDPNWVQRELTEMALRGIVGPNADGSAWYAYDCSHPLHATIVALADAYAGRRVSVISLIFAKPVDAIQSFAEAFKLRKERSDG
jgi:hypothetical protein